MWSTPEFLPVDFTRDGAASRCRMRAEGAITKRPRRTYALIDATLLAVALLCNSIAQTFSCRLAISLCVAAERVPSEAIASMVKRAMTSGISPGLLAAIVRMRLKPGSRRVAVERRTDSCVCLALDEPRPPRCLPDRFTERAYADRYRARVKRAAA